jgi:hypothetical protein
MATDADDHVGFQTYSLAVSAPAAAILVVLSAISARANTVRFPGLAEGNLLEVAGNNTGTAPPPPGTLVYADGTYGFAPGYTPGPLWARTFNQGTQQWSAWAWQPGG